MSLAINLDKVNRVLLSDGWHVVLNESFALDAYEYLWYPNEDTTIMDTELVHYGGQSGICATGFKFQGIGNANDGTLWMYGPLTAIQAVETKE